MQQKELEANQELRIQVGDEPIELELRRGLAEVHGTEMLANKTYVFAKNSSVAVFTYHGALIELTGNPLKCHIGQKCDYMNFYLNIHADLEKMRDEAERHFKQTKEPDLSKTPICLVCKPYYSTTKVGKSTFCRILLNYAARRGRTPVFVNLDPEKGSIGLPGTIGALSIESQIDIENGLCLKSPMVLHFGHTTPDVDSSTLLYKTLVENLARIVHSKLEQDDKTFFSGIIINACSWKEDTKNEILIHACKTFKTNVICVMDDEVLVDDLQQSIQSQVRIINAPRTVSIIAPDSQLELRYKRIREYFYGTNHKRFSPTTRDLPFSFIRKLIYTIGNPLMLPDSLMPLGTKQQNASLKIVPYDCKPTNLLNHILAVSYATLEEVGQDPSIVLRSNLMGFICVTNVRNEDGGIIILAPQKLPNPMNKVLLFSDVRYLDSLLE